MFECSRLAVIFMDTQSWLLIYLLFVLAGFGVMILTAKDTIALKMCLTFVDDMHMDLTKLSEGGKTDVQNDSRLHPSETQTEQVQSTGAAMFLRNPCPI
jgi:hypothetical protein